MSISEYKISKFILHGVSRILRIYLYCLLFCGSLAAQSMFYKGPTDAAGDPAALREGVMDGNRIILTLQNSMEYLYAYWPKGEQSQLRHYQNPFIVTTHVYINKENGLPADQPAEIEYLSYRGHLDTLYFCQTNARYGMDQSRYGIRWGFYPVWGYFNPSGNSPAMSNKPESWPPGGWPANCFARKWPGEWNSRFGRGVQIADLEMYMVANDAQDQEYLQEDSPVKYYPRPGVFIGDIYPDVAVQKGMPWGGLGLRIELRIYQWDNLETRDCVFFEYMLTNLSDYDYPETGLGFLINSILTAYNHPYGYYNKDLDMVYSWDENDIIQGGSSLVTTGFAILETTGNPDDGIDNDEDGLVDERCDNQPLKIIGATEGIASLPKFLERYGLQESDLHDHWDADEDQDWQDGVDLNNNGRYDREEYAGDDVGLDGLGPDDINYPGPDEGECDHKPSFEAGIGCEPNFNATDNSENDMLGLTARPKANTNLIQELDDDKRVFQLISSGSFDNTIHEW